MQHEIELAAMDKAGIHMELVKPFSASTVEEVCVDS